MEADLEFDFESTLEAQQPFAANEAGAGGSVNIGPGGRAEPKPRNYRQVRCFAPQGNISRIVFAFQSIQLIHHINASKQIHLLISTDGVHLLASRFVHERRHMRIPSPVRP